MLTLHRVNCLQDAVTYAFVLFFSRLQWGQEANKRWSPPNGNISGGGYVWFYTNAYSMLLLFLFTYMSFYVLRASCWGWNGWCFGCRRHGLGSSCLVKNIHLLIRGSHTHLWGGNLCSVSLSFSWLAKAWGRLLSYMLVDARTSSSWPIWKCLIHVRVLQKLVFDRSGLLYQLLSLLFLENQCLL